MLTTSTNLKPKIDALWDKFWSGGISNPLTAIEQMYYLNIPRQLADSYNKKNGAMTKRRGEQNTSPLIGYEDNR